MGSKGSRISNACNANIRIHIILTNKFLSITKKKIDWGGKAEVGIKKKKIKSEIYAKLIANYQNTTEYEQSSVQTLEFVSPKQSKEITFNDDEKYLTILAEILPNNGNFNCLENEHPKIIIFENKIVKDLVNDSRIVVYIADGFFVYGKLLKYCNFKMVKGNSGFNEQRNYPIGWVCECCKRERCCTYDCKNSGNGGYYEGDGVYFGPQC